MAHLDEDGKLVPCTVTWTKSAEYGKQLKRLASANKLSLDEILRRINRPERNPIFEALYNCTDEQLDRLELLCPLAKDLTLEVIAKAKQE